MQNVYAKCGSTKDAQRVFNKMPSHYVFSCNAILGGYAMHGHGKEALKIFGRLSEGIHCYASMNTDYMISEKLENYTCMVNLLVLQVIYTRPRV